MRRRILILLLATGAAAGGPPEEESATALAVVKRLQQERVGLAGKLAQAVCAVFRGRGGGSGVIITDDGLVLSNYHVTGLENEMRIGLNDHRIHRAVVLGVDPSGDLSLLRLKEDRKWVFSPLGDSDALHQGDWVYAMGNPFLLATDFSPTITLGVVSGINRYQPGSIRGTLLYPDCIQTDASINPGNSGGPLFNFKGEVVGINGRVSLRDRGRVNIGVGYAISSNQIKLCLPDLRAGKIVQHGTRNATVRSIEDPEWPGGVRITFDQILAPGCAHDAGIQVGDALMEFQSEPITSVNQFSRLIAILPQGRRVDLKVKRYDNAEEGWQDQAFRLTLDGIPLVTKKAAAQKKPPVVFREHEIDRTFAAARAALQPLVNEKRVGTFQVRGRDELALEERYKDGSFTLKLGDRVRTATPEGGTDGGKALDPDYRADMLERVAAWNDLGVPDARRTLAEVKFTGGALVNGVTADRIEVKTADGAERVYFIHMQTGRLLRLDLYSNTWVKWMSHVFSDWRKAGGLLRPYKVTVWDREKETLLQTIQYKAIQQG